MRSASLAAVFAVLALSQTPPQATRAASRDLTLVEGRGELLTFQRDVTKVAISEPKVADAVVISPREVMVNAKGVGRATLLVWETGAEPARWEIQVVKDTSEWEAFTKAISESAGTPVTVTGTGETIVLYSEMGVHGGQAWVFLRALGHRHVVFLRNGLHEWLDDVMSPTICKREAHTSR